MASDVALAIACDGALQTIEKCLSIESGSLPRLHRDREILRKLQLEAIAELLQSSDKASSADSELEAVRQLARNGATKAEIVTALLGPNMATLSVSQLSKMRRTIGDNAPDDSGNHDLTDGEIQDAYDTSNDNWWICAVDLLEQRRGIWINEIDTITRDGAGQTRNQKPRNIERLLQYARERAGINGTLMQVGSFDEGLFGKMSQLKATGLKETQKAMKAKRDYVLRVKGTKGTSILVTPQIVSKSLAIARKTLTKSPGKPKYPLRWKSNKQRKAVMAKLRKAGNLPYSRSGRIQRAWKGEIDTNEVIIANEAKDPATGEFYAEYVFGKDQQPFHKDTGWQKENDNVTRKIVQPIKDGLADIFIKGIARAE